MSTMMPAFHLSRQRPRSCRGAFTPAQGQSVAEPGCSVVPAYRASRLDPLTVRREH